MQIILSRKAFFVAKKKRCCGMAKLRDKQQRFVDECVIGPNATQAAIRAGYSKKSARSIASENLTKPDIAKEVEQKKKAEAEKLNKATAQLRSKLVLAAAEALDVMIGILRDKSASRRDKITVSRDILDRAGFKPSAKLELSGELTTNPYAGLTESELRKLAGVANGQP
jgi:phage terminase small subunit